MAMAAEGGGHVVVAGAGAVAQMAELPVELAEAVLSFLDLDGLAAASRTCRTWKEVIEREDFAGWSDAIHRMYRACPWRGKRPLWLLIREDEHGRRRRFRSMLQSLVTSPIGRSLLLAPLPSDALTAAAGPGARSTRGGNESVYLVVVNHLSCDVEWRWVDWDGVEVVYPISPCNERSLLQVGPPLKSLPPRSVKKIVHLQQTYTGHPWVARAADTGVLLGGVVAVAAAPHITIHLHPWTCGVAPGAAPPPPDLAEDRDRFADMWEGNDDGSNDE
jgi:hypothetical protein